MSFGHRCPQGQALEGWEHEPASGQQWFRAPAAAEYCPHCWHAARCPRCFGYAAGEHETLLGLIPLASRVAGRLLQQVRPWIEPAQSFEKNQLGLSQMFFNSLRLTWQMSLWADSAVLLRTLAWLDAPKHSSLLAGLQPQQLEFGLPSEIWLQVKNRVFSNESLLRHFGFRNTLYNTAHSSQCAAGGDFGWNMKFDSQQCVLS
jgi:hypothetical protein